MAGFRCRDLGFTRVLKALGVSARGIARTFPIVAAWGLGMGVRPVASAGVGLASTCPG